MCAVSCAMAGQETAFWQAHGSSGHESQQILQAIMMTHFTCYPSHWDIQPLPPLKKKWPHAKKPSKFFKVTTLKCNSADANISREIGRTGQINNQHRRCFTTSSTILTHQTVTSYYKVIAIVAQTTSLRMSD